MALHIPPSKLWLDGAKANMRVDERNPRVARILEILRKREASGITTAEHKEFMVLNYQLLSAYGTLYGKTIYPTCEVTYDDCETHSREEIIAAIDKLFEQEGIK